MPSSKRMEHSLAGIAFDSSMDMKPLRSIFVLFLSIHLALSPAYATGDDAANVQFSVGTSSDVINPLVKIDIKVSQLDDTAEAVSNIAELALQKVNSGHSTVVLSSDNEELIQSERFENKPTTNLVLVPIPDENSKKQVGSSFVQLLKNFKDKRIESIKSDKIGLMVVTYTTLTETLVWIHSTQLSQFEKTGNIIYTVMLATIFGLNKDAWSLTTKPIQKFFRNILKPEDQSRTNVKQLASQFLGNLTLAGIVTSVRIPLMSMDQIIHQGLQLHFFTMPLLLTLVSTAAIFTWSEHIASINEKTHGVTKFIFRRANEVRSMIIGTFATTAALLNPGQHGLMPWITMASIGVVGATIYLNSESISNWIESNPKLKPLKDHLNQSSFGGRCQALF